MTYRRRRAERRAALENSTTTATTARSTERGLIVPSSQLLSFCFSRYILSLSVSLSLSFSSLVLRAAKSLIGARPRFALLSLSNTLDISDRRESHSFRAPTNALYYTSCKHTAREGAIVAHEREITTAGTSYRLVAAVTSDRCAAEPQQPTLFFTLRYILIQRRCGRAPVAKHDRGKCSPRYI